jgi:hypothetical protein
VASSSSSKKIDRRREASAANKRISRRGSIVSYPPKDPVSVSVPVVPVSVPVGGSEVDGGAGGGVEVAEGVRVQHAEGRVAEEEVDAQAIPEEIREVYEELRGGGGGGEGGGEGVSLAAIVSWSVMQDAIHCAFMSEVVMWNEFMTLVSTRKKKRSTRASISGNDLLKLDAFYLYCVRLQQIIDTNIDMMESIDLEGTAA